jgi:uncharacterized protein (TIGR00369 family)
VIDSVPGLRHYNPIGSVHGGYAAILLDSAMGLAVQSTLPVGTGYTTLEFKISFVRGMSETSGVVRTEGRVLNAGSRVVTAEARITDAKGRLLAHATTTCHVFEIPKGNACCAKSIPKTFRQDRWSFSAAPHHGTRRSELVVTFHERTTKVVRRRGCAAAARWVLASKR